MTRIETRHLRGKLVVVRKHVLQHDGSLWLRKWSIKFQAFLLWEIGVQKFGAWPEADALHDHGDTWLLAIAINRRGAREQWAKIITRGESIGVVRRRKIKFLVPRFYSQNIAHKVFDCSGLRSFQVWFSPKHYMLDQAFYGSRNS